MKMKKLLIVVSMLAVMFSLAGCKDEKQKAFEYDETQIVLDTVYLFNEYSEVSDEYVDYYLTDGTEFEQSAVKGVQQAINTDKVGEFEDFDKYFASTASTAFKVEDVKGEIEDSEDSVTVTIINKAENRDVEITVKYVENADYYIQYDKLSQEINEESIANEITTYYGYTVEEFLESTGYPDLETIVTETIESNLQQEEIYPYVPEEMVVTAVYSSGELMKQAGMNTLIGMGTVFIVLIFISFIISLFKYLPALFAKKPTIPEIKEEKAPVAVKKETVKADDNLMNDAELVAVITAAIYAASGSTGNGAVSKDKLVVRSIKRAKR